MERHSEPRIAPANAPVQTQSEAPIVCGCLILTGGGSTRMGADKAELIWEGMRAVDRLLALAKTVLTGPAFTVGFKDYGPPFIADDQPGCGPVGGIIKGCSVLDELDVPLALVLAVDAPTLTKGDLEPLLQCGREGAAYADFHLPMVLSSKAVPADAAPGWSINRLIERAGLQRLSCPSEAQARVRGANTPLERAALRLALESSTNAPGGGPISMPRPVVSD